MKTVRTVVANDLRRLVRERSNLFFVFLFPLLLVLLIGLSFGGDLDRRLAVTAPDTPLASDLVDALAASEDVVVDRYADADAVIDAVARGRADAGVSLPEEFDTLGAAVRGATVRFVARPQSAGASLQALVTAAVTEQSGRLAAAATAERRGGVAFAEALAAVDASRGDLPALTTRLEVAGQDALADEFEGLGRFDLGASTQLLLFTFVTAMSSSVVLIQARRWGITRRVLATPTRASVLVVAQALGRFAVALVQAIVIVVGTAVLFGVAWGDPLAAAALVTVFAAVSAGAGMLLGAVAENDAQAGGVGAFLGLGLAALGGCMLPLDLFSPTLTRIAHITPHAWAYDAFATLVRRGGSLGDILVEIAVLAGTAGVLLVAAGWRLHRITVRAAGR